MKRKIWIGLTLIAVLCCSVWAQGGGDRGTTEATVDGKTVSINYGRPDLKGRDIFGWAKVGQVWRLGKNQATEISSTGDLEVGGTELKAGKYSLWAKKTGANTWTLNFHPKTGIWGTPELTEGYVASLPLKMNKVSDASEPLTIALEPASGDNVKVKIHWGTAELSGEFKVK